MRLFVSSTSPFAAKARMAAAACDIAVETQVVDTVVEPAELLAANPSGKVPTLVLDDGTTLYDSQVICEYFDRLSGNRIVPQTSAEWIEAKRLEATAGGVMDAAALVVYEGRFRPPEMHHRPWTDRQWGKALRGLAVLEREIGEVPAEPTIGHLAVAAMLGWFEFRFAGRWEADHPKLLAWKDGFFARFPALAQVKPRP